jgi:hypothetical protein
MKTISSAMRLAWPRLWVVIRMRAPPAAISPMMRSTSRVLPGSRLAVGSSRISSSGSSAQARASATRCCSPPESSRAGRRAMWSRPARASAARARRRLSSGRMALQLQAVHDVGQRRGTQHHRPLEHHALGQRLRPVQAAAARMQQAVDQAQQGALAGAVGAEHDGALRGERQRHVVDDAGSALGQTETVDGEPGGAHPHCLSAQPRMA